MARVTRPSRLLDPVRPGPICKYTVELADEICHRLSLGESLRTICKDKAMPSMATIMRWLNEIEDFENKYMRARAFQAHVWIDEMRDLSTSEPERNPVTGALDSASVNHIRNQVSTLQWLAMKLNPKRYGDRTAVEHQGGISLTVVTGVPQPDAITGRKPDAKQIT